MNLRARKKINSEALGGGVVAADRSLISNVFGCVLVMGDIYQYCIAIFYRYFNNRFIDVSIFMFLMGDIYRCCRYRYLPVDISPFSINILRIDLLTYRYLPHEYWCCDCHLPKYFKLLAFQKLGLKLISHM